MNDSQRDNADGGTLLAIKMKAGSAVGRRGKTQGKIRNRPSWVTPVVSDRTKKYTGQVLYMHIPPIGGTVAQIVGEKNRQQHTEREGGAEALGGRSYTYKRALAKDIRGLKPGSKGWACV